MVKFLSLARIDIAGIPGIAEPDAPLTIDRQVIRGIQPYAVQLVDNGRCAAILLEAYYRLPPEQQP